MFAIGWLELGEPDRAQQLLEKCFNNIQGPFQVLEHLSDTKVELVSDLTILCLFTTLLPKGVE